MINNSEHDDRDDTIDGEPASVSNVLELRRPDVPVDLNELAAQKSGALEIIEARALVLATLRRAAIRATSPEDWLLFKAPAEHGGQVVAYLQDCGADRVRDLYGIEIYGVSRPERIATNDPGVFHYLIKGSGRCKLTRQTVENVEGGRSSTDDFCKGKTGLALELAVRKAARANLDGSLTRELSGLQSVAVAELDEGWAGTRKKSGDCRKGRGFGTRDERLGGVTAADQGIAPPVCRLCNKPMTLKTGSRGPFYSCPNFRDHGKEAYVVDFEKWKQQAAVAAPAAEPAAPASSATTNGAAPANSTKVTPPSADEVFGPPTGEARRRRERTPGEEG